VTASKFYDWRQRYGCINEHNGWVPRDFWLELREKEAIIEFHLKNPLEGYRRLTFMMLTFENIFDIFFLPQVPFIHRGGNFAADQWNRLGKEADGLCAAIALFP
jgi:hypothetical protein